MKRASSVRRRITSAGRPTSSAPTGQPERLAAAAGGQPEGGGGGDGARVRRGGAGQQRGEPHLVPQMEIVVGGGSVGSEPHPHAPVQQRPQPRHPRAQLPVGARAVGHRNVVCDHQVELGVVQPHRMGGQHAPLEHARLGQERQRARPVALAHHFILGQRLVQMDLHERVAPLRLDGDGPQPLGRHGVRRVGAEAEMQAALPAVHGVVAPARLLEHRLPHALVAWTLHVEDGRGVHGPDARVHERLDDGPGVAVLLAGRRGAVAQQLRRAQRHAPVDVLVGQPRFAWPDGLAQPSVQGQPVARAAHQRHRRVAVAVDQPGHEQAPELVDLGPGGGRHLPGVADPGDEAVLDLHRARQQHGVVPVDGDDGVGHQPPNGHGVATNSRSDE